MSRTIRRKNAYKPYWLYSNYERTETGIWERIPKGPKELAVCMARYHGDKDQHSNASKWFRSQEHNDMKSLSKGELARFWKDPENYEVQIVRRLKRDYWD